MFGIVPPACSCILYASLPDPNAKKPDDWDESAPATLPDPDAEKPEGWLDNAPEQIPDPTARRPDDWSDAEDGEWIAPLVPNPDCEEVGCGTWERPTIPNPAYKGKVRLFARWERVLLSLC